MRQRALRGGRFGGARAFHGEPRGVWMDPGTIALRSLNASVLLCASEFQNPSLLYVGVGESLSGPYLRTALTGRASSLGGGPGVAPRAGGTGLKGRNRRGKWAVGVEKFRWSVPDSAARRKHGFLPGQLQASLLSFGPVPIAALCRLRFQGCSCVAVFAETDMIRLPLHHPAVTLCCFSAKALCP